MSTPTPPPPARNRKAEAKAAKAYAKAERPWYKKKRFVIPIVAVALIGLGSLAGGGSDDGPKKVDAVAESSEGASSSSGGADTEGTASDDAGSKKNPIKVGETVELEGTRYTVNAVSTAPTIGDQYFSETASGLYVIVDLTIENTKDETKTFSDSAAKFIGNNGKSYSTDTDGTIASTGDGKEALIFTEMQPDVPTSGRLVFDVAPAVVANGLLELSDLFGRGEAYVDLGLS